MGNIMEKNMEEILSKAEVLIEALPYIQRFNRKIIVVKYGGSAMSSEELQKNVIKDVTLLKLVGFKPIIVHGGGKEISRWVGKVGKEAKDVDPKILYDLLERDFLPIVAPIGMDDNFQTYNINADDAACAIAKAVGAEKLAFLTDIEGLYKDINDKSSFISRLSASEADQLINDGFIGGGMLPKLANCTSAIKNGVNRVHILDGRIPHCLLLEIFTQKGIGTAIVKDDEVDKIL